MNTWTKADIKRMQTVLDLVALQTERSLRHDTPDEHRDRVNAHLRDEARSIVRDGLLDCGSNGRLREHQANKRIATRLCTEDLPAEVIIPQVITHREVEANLREQDEREAARVAAENAKPEPVVYHVDVERDRKTILFNLTELRERGVVEVHRATSDAFGTDTTWADLKPVTWQTWARPAAERRNCVDAWDRCTSDVDKLAANTGPIGLLWGFACEEDTLPDVLDLRGVPSVRGVPHGPGWSGDLPTQRWLDALAVALRKAKLGIVLVVDCEPWVLGRLLPTRVGS
jgi:hypothetical protein